VQEHFRDSFQKEDRNPHGPDENLRGAPRASKSTAADRRFRQGASARSNP
jgi:hypothetical protein